MDTVLFSSELFTDNTASAMTQTANEKTPTFEEAMAELEALVRKMEEGKLALEESVEAFNEMGSERFGRGAELYPKNILETRKFELRTPEVVIRATPAGVSAIETRMIDGRKYILIEAQEDGTVELNGLPLTILP